MTLSDGSTENRFANLAMESLEFVVSKGLPAVLAGFESSALDSLVKGLSVEDRIKYEHTLNSLRLVGVRFDGAFYTLQSPGMTLSVLDSALEHYETTILWASHPKMDSCVYSKMTMYEVNDFEHLSRYALQVVYSLIQDIESIVRNPAGIYTWPSWRNVLPRHLYFELEWAYKDAWMFRNRLTMEDLALNPRDGAIFQPTPNLERLVPPPTPGLSPPAHISSSWTWKSSGGTTTTFSGTGYSSSTTTTTSIPKPPF